MHSEPQSHAGIGSRTVICDFDIAVKSTNTTINIQPNRIREEHA
jgi:hypothetical protein